MEKRLIDPNRSLKQLERDIKNLKVESPCEYKKEKEDIKNHDDKIKNNLAKKD